MQSETLQENETLDRNGLVLELARLNASLEQSSTRQEPLLPRCILCFDQRLLDSLFKIALCRFVLEDAVKILDQ